MIWVDLGSSLKSLAKANMDYLFLLPHLKMGGRRAGLLNQSPPALAADAAWNNYYVSRT
ncbi:MAG TPA: hypothetical protein VGE24_14080 [Emticicia sp.]